MDEYSTERVELLLKLGGRTIHPSVTYAQKGIFEEAEKLFNDYYNRLLASPAAKADEQVDLTILAFQFAIRIIELRGSKADNVLAPTMESLLGDIEETLELLEK